MRRKSCIQNRRGIAALLVCVGLSSSHTVSAQENTDNSTVIDPRSYAFLHLNEKQKLAFFEFYKQQHMNRNSKKTLNQDQILALTTPERWSYVADFIQYDLDVIRAQIVAVDKFYDLLSPDQRKLFNEGGHPRQVFRPNLAEKTTINATPDLDNPSLPGWVAPAWLTKPSMSDIARVYPTKARNTDASGQVVLICTVDTDGYLFDCNNAEETPKDLGFGNAALEITAYMRMSPALKYGRPVTSSVTIPIRFIPNVADKSP